MRSDNPFHELYVTELVGPDEFAQLFSPFVLKYAQLLFQQGNLVLLGSQGSGKSMLLSLLKPEIRYAYIKQNIPFPVPPRFDAFLGAGININRSGAINMGQRPLSSNKQHDEMLFPLFFADFVNYWIVRDVLRSFDFVSRYSSAFGNMADQNSADLFASQLAKNSCWFGYLDSVKTFADLEARLDERISLYRKYHQFNIEQLPEEVSASKTAIGEPISKTAKYMHDNGLLSSNVPVLIRIDELHLLLESDELRPRLGDEYRKVINKALANRDPMVSYKIATRTYAWEHNPKVFGTTASLERDRDYRIVDLDNLLRRKENRKTWIFPDFARDVFTKRLTYSTFNLGKSKNALLDIMGSGLSPDNAAKRYAQRSTARIALQIPDNWPDQWKNFLFQLYEKDKLLAILAGAWARQKGGAKRENRLLCPPPIGDQPWERKYWKKERINQALLQLATHCAQRIMWCGQDDILSLSGGNVLVFLSICQHIWDAFLQSERGKTEQEEIDPLRSGIDETVQAVGIFAASSYWYKKMPERSGGTERQRFIEKLGVQFQEELNNDKAMSYPGHNGFSILKDELRTSPAIEEFLAHAVEYDDLREIPHTTKEKNRRPRLKYYLNPILSPYFKIPESHVKEPMYVRVSLLRKWLLIAKVHLDDQLRLFSRSAFKE